VPHPGTGTPVARGHLRLATRSEASRRSGGRLVFALRSILVAAAVLWISTVAWLGATLALLPLVWRRAPLGRRLRPRPSREVRVIPFQPRRQAMPP
jgi:hypothetical protein